MSAVNEYHDESHQRIMIIVCVCAMESVYQNPYQWYSLLYIACGTKT